MHVTRTRFWRDRWRAHTSSGRALHVAVVAFGLALVVLAVAGMVSAGMVVPALAWSLGVPAAALATAEHAYRAARHKYPDNPTS